MILADTGFFLGLANATDQHHEACVDALDHLEGRERLITTWPVLTETTHLLLHRLGTPALLAFMRSLDSDAFDIFPLEPTHAPRLSELMERYADLPMDLADASLVLLAEHLGHGRIVSTDQRDFRTYRWKQRKPFKNLLLTA